MAEKKVRPAPKPVGDVVEVVKRSWEFEGKEYFNQRDAHVARMVALLQVRASSLGLSHLNMDYDTLRNLVENAEHFTPMLEEFCAKMEALQLTPDIAEEEE